MVRGGRHHEGDSTPQRVPRGGGRRGTVHTLNPKLAGTTLTTHGWCLSAERSASGQVPDLGTDEGPPFPRGALRRHSFEFAVALFEMNRTLNLEPEPSSPHWWSQAPGLSLIKARPLNKAPAKANLGSALK